MSGAKFTNEERTSGALRSSERSEVLSDAKFECLREIAFVYANDKKWTDGTAV
jgi:hypothetical protein